MEVFNTQPLEYLHPKTVNNTNIGIGKDVADDSRAVKEEEPVDNLGSVA